MIDDTFEQMSIIYEMTTEICWSTLWDTARKMKAKEVEQLEEIYWDKEPDTGMLKILRANYNHPLTNDQVKNLCLNFRY